VAQVTKRSELRRAERLLARRQDERRKQRQRELAELDDASAQDKAPAGEGAPVSGPSARKRSRGVMCGLKFHDFSSCERFLMVTSRKQIFLLGKD
jgi:hypothetical protein